MSGDPEQVGVFVPIGRLRMLCAAISDDCSKAQILEILRRMLLLPRRLPGPHDVTRKRGP